MSQLDRLTRFITDNVPDWVMYKFRASIENAEMIRAPKDLGLNQRRFGVIRYTATFDWDDFPYRRYSAAEIYALVFAWLDEQANDLRFEFELSDPDISVDFDEELTSPFVITLELAESIDAVQDDNGTIPYKGKRWRLIYPNIHVAARGFLFAIDQCGAPLGG